ncbi:MAG: proline dehydrogenase family protein [Ferruginibacter sp.]|nr:proline dehydrogenase family protein [Cytophagales bacterium]
MPVTQPPSGADLQQPNNPHQSAPRDAIRVSFEDTSIAFSAKSDGALEKMYWLFASMNNNGLVRLGTSLMQAALKLRLPVKAPIKYTVFAHFCGGETIRECEATIQELGRFGIGTILDYSVEGEKTEAGFNRTTQETLATIEKAGQSEHIPFAVFKVTGIASADLLEKVQGGVALTAAEKTAFEQAKERVDAICRRAADRKVRVFFDGEESWIQDVIDGLAYEMMERYNRTETFVFNTFQMYRRASLDNLKEAVGRAETNGYFLGVKLVRGAYMEKESRRAAQRGYADPIQPDKEAADRDFDRAAGWCLAARPRVALCLGTHNENSCLLLIEEMRRRGIAPDDPNVWFAQLYGMSDNISYNLAEAGYRVAKYVPYGPVEAVMPYLFRRAEENTSVAGQSSREFNLIKKERTRRKKAREK